MKLILITLVAVVVGLMVGCESASRTSMLIPTPSGPMYSEEEAMAVLKEHLQTKIFPGEPYPCLLVIEDKIRNPNSVTWDASYDDDGRLWNITAKSKNLSATLVEKMFKDAEAGTPEPASMWAPFGATATPSPTLPKPKYYTWSLYERTGSIVATGDDPINQMC